MKHGDVGKRFKVEWSWANKGVAPCYPGGYPALTLKDDDGGIVSVLTDETLNMRDLEVGPPGEAPVPVLVPRAAAVRLAENPSSYEARYGARFTITAEVVRESDEPLVVERGPAEAYAEAQWRMFEALAELKASEERCRTLFNTSDHRILVPGSILMRFLPVLMT